MAVWKEYKIGDLCDTISETYRGHDEEVILINTSDVLEGRILNHQKVPNRNVKGQFKKTFKTQDILYSEIRPENNRFAYVDMKDTSLYIASTKLMVIRANIEIIEPRFLYAILTAKSMTQELQVRAELRSGTFPQITFKTELATIKVCVPDRKTQKKIVSFLDAINRKIEVNNKINRNLSEQLKAIFSKMFPTITDNGSNTLEEIISFSNGKKRPDTEGKVPVYGGNGILSYTDKSNAENCVIIGRVGAYCGSLYLSVEPCWISDNAIKAKAKNSNSQMFIYYLLQELALSNRHIGTSQPLLTQGILNAIPFNCPSEEDVISFCKKADDIQKLIDMNTIENKRISELRDTLLPKLMSGELDVSDLDI